MLTNSVAFAHNHEIANILSTGKFATSANGANMVDGCNKARLRAERIEPSMLGNPPSFGRYLGAFGLNRHWDGGLAGGISGACGRRR